MNNTKLKQLIIKVLKRDERLWSEDKTELNQTLLLDLVESIDERVIELLLEEEDLREKFFVKIKDVYVFKTDEFRFFMEENRVDNSYTAYKNRIGLTDGKRFLKDTNDVVLDFPYKDCVLEGGQSKEDGLDTYVEYSEKTKTYEEKKSKRKEIFFNSVLAYDEIDRLFDPKAFVNWKRYTKDKELEVKEIKRDEDGTIRENIIIKGNNLLALHSLKKQFAGKVKLIYIDPPYNKKGDSFYNDAFKQSSWLTFMKNRLDIAKQLLSDDGIIFVQIDTNQLAYLHVLLDDIFEKRKQAIISIKVKSPSGDSSKIEKLVEDVTEYILVYSKQDNFKSLSPIAVKEVVDKNSKTASQYNCILISKGQVSTKAFDFYIGTGKNKTKIEVFNVEGFELRRIPKKELSRDFFVKNYEKVCRTAKFSGEFLKQFKDKRGSYFFKYTPTRGKNAGIETETYVYKGEGLIYLKDFSEIIELDDGGKAVAKLEAATNFISDIPWQGIAKEGGVTLTKGKKPEELLRRIIEWATKPTDLVMDFFVGSGTTCAVAHKMGRQYIGIEQLDYGKNSAVVRLKNVINGDQTGISKSVNWQGGGDFIYFELAKWNETAKEKILACESLEELENFFDEMYERYFLNYNLKIKEFKEKVIKEENFRNLALEEQKKIFIAMLDNNQMYVNKTEMMDKKFGINKEDQRLTSQFYNSEK